MAEQNPYQQQTEANTSIAWLNDQAKVDVDLDTMAEFAKHAVTIKDNLNSHTGYLDLLGTLPMKAWEDGALPEGTWFKNQMLGNCAELSQYLLRLATALDNIGMAAQTIADTYASTDGWSAASLDAVNFAFGDPTVRKPGNLPPWVTGKTYFQAQEEAMAAAAKAGSTANTQWVDAGQRIEPGGAITSRANSPDGRSMEITTFTAPFGGPTTVTTRVFAADGKLLSQSSTVSSTYLDGKTVKTVTKSYDEHGTQTGGKTEYTTYGDKGVKAEGTANVDKDDKPTTSTETTTADDGTQTIKTTRDGKVVREIHIGKQTEGVEGLGDMPGKQAIADVTAKYDDKD